MKLLKLTLLAGVLTEEDLIVGARTATWSGTIRLFRLGSRLANEAGGKRQERERSRTGADDTAGGPRGSSAAVVIADGASSADVCGWHCRSRPTINRAIANPAATAPKGRLNMNMGTLLDPPPAERGELAPDCRHPRYL
jgi:hypothetical protein